MSATAKHVRRNLNPNNERQRLHGLVWTELHRSISTEISEAISQMAPTPWDSFVRDNLRQQGYKAQPCILLGRAMISFGLPKSITSLNYINLDVQEDRSEDIQIGEYTMKSGLCFMRRRQGWIIERLQCKTCLHLDTIYRHVEANRQFRSVAGALSYIYYGEYPLIQEKITVHIEEHSTTVKLPEEIHLKLFHVLKAIISETISPLKKRPEDFSAQANQTSIVPYIDRTYYKRKKTSHNLLGELHTSFVIPEGSEIECFNIDQIERPSNFRRMYAASNVRLFCFKERMSDWIIERTQRENGVLETFYYHSGFGRTLRSYREVVNFILYEVYPVHPNSYKELKMANPEKCLHVAQTAKASPSKEELEDSHVVNFLRKSLHNMQILSSYKSTAETVADAVAGNQSQWKKDENEKGKDTVEEIPNRSEPLPALQSQAQPTDSGVLIRARLEGTQDGEGSVGRNKGKEIAKDVVEDSSGKVQVKEEKSDILESHWVDRHSRIVLNDVYELSSSSEVLKMYSEFEWRNANSSNDP